MPPVGIEPAISAGEPPQTFALDRAATMDGPLIYKLWRKPAEIKEGRICFVNSSFSSLIFCHPFSIILLPTSDVSYTVNLYFRCHSCEYSAAI